jgi:YspA, cpYpsA-related SLOG family
MRVLVCGPRDWTDETYVWDILDCFVLSKITLLISGCADGIDAISCEWANERGIAVLPFPARWRKHKNGAGPIRNHTMLEKGKPDLVIAFRYSGQELTTGTANMIQQTKKSGVKYRVYPPLSELTVRS